MLSRCHVEIRLAHGGRIDISVEVDGERRLWESIAGPAQAVDLLRERLGTDDQRAVTVVLRAGDEQMRAWTTNSSALALYWAAAALGNAWDEATRRNTEASPSVAKESGPIRVNGAPTAADPKNKNRVA